MTDTPQNQSQIRASSGTPSTPAAPYKKGDIVWVVYKKTNWPAKVSAYYPKEKRISYVFFPLQKKNSIFKTDPSKVQHFKLEDQLPEDAAPDLEESFSQARRMLEGVSEEEIIMESEQKNELSASSFATPSASAKKKKTTAELLKKTTTAKNTPKSQHTGKKKATGTPAVGGTPAAQPKAPVFKTGDPVIVDTTQGMWPGLFLSFEKDNPKLVNYSLFPREEHPHEVMQSPSNTIMPFPPEQVEQAIEEGRNNNSEMLLTALVDVQAYLKEKAQQQKQKQSSSGAGGGGGVKITPKSGTGNAVGGGSKSVGGSASKETPKVAKKTPTMELTPPREAYKNARKSAMPRKSVPIRDEENETAAEAKKNTASPNGQQKEGGGVAESAPKKRKIGEMMEENVGKEEMVAKSMSPMGTRMATAAAAAQHSPLKQARSEGGVMGKRVMSDAERDKQLQHLGELVEKRKREKELMKSPQKEAKVEEEGPKLKEAKEQPGSPPLLVSPKVVVNAATPVEKKVVEAKRELPLYEWAISGECRAHMEKLWKEKGGEWFKTAMHDGEEMNLDFRNGGIFSFKELESMVPIFQKWIVSTVYGKLCPNMPRFSQLRELFLISKHMLPEICAFVLAKKNGSTLEEAKQSYTEKFAVSLLPSTPLGDSPIVLSSASSSSSQPKKQNNSLSTLIEAANMMEGEPHNGTTSNGAQDQSPPMISPAGMTDE